MLKITRKRFGQHFLRDQNILHKIVRTIAPSPQDLLVEIGPGQGDLTQLLLASQAQVEAIEIDRDLVSLLQQKFSENKNFHLYSADILKFDLSQLIQHEKKLRVVGNLPYNISTPLLFKLFDFQNHIQDMHFMLQKEVVERLTAPVGSSHYGRLSVMAQYFCHCEAIFTLPPQVFSPPPQVESTFVRLVPKKNLPTVDLKIFSRIVKEAFTYRRKTLSNALKNIITPQQLIDLHINPQLRPQQLTVEDFVKISNNI